MEEILQGNLNTIYFGRCAYGIQAAAQATSARTPPTSTYGKALRWRRSRTGQLDGPGRGQGGQGRGEGGWRRERSEYVVGGMAEIGRSTLTSASRWPFGPPRLSFDLDLLETRQLRGAASASATPTSIAAGSGWPWRSPPMIRAEEQKSGVDILMHPSQHWTGSSVGRRRDRDATFEQLSPWSRRRTDHRAGQWTQSDPRGHGDADRGGQPAHSS